MGCSNPPKVADDKLVRRSASGRNCHPHERILAEIQQEPHRIEASAIAPEDARAALTILPRPALVRLLEGPDSPECRAVSKLLLAAVDSRNMLTERDRQRLRHAFRTVLADHPEVMGVLTRPPSHAGRGTTPGPEILVTAALKLGTFTSAAGRRVHIHKEDSLHFGRRTEWDILKLSGGLAVAYDVKYSQNGLFDTTVGLAIQLSSVRAKFHDGTLQEFLYVTPGRFGPTFTGAIEQTNRDIVARWAREHPDSATDQGVDALNADGIRDFAQRRNIPQVDYCERVNLAGRT